MVVVGSRALRSISGWLAGHAARRARFSSTLTPEGQEWSIGFARTLRDTRATSDHDVRLDSVHRSGLVSNQRPAERRWRRRGHTTWSLRQSASPRR
jgi:hypothetical protein